MSPSEKNKFIKQIGYARINELINNRSTLHKSDFKVLYKEKLITDKASGHIGYNLQLFVDNDMHDLEERDQLDDSDSKSNDSISSASASELDFLFNHDVPNLFEASQLEKKIAEEKKFAD